MEGIILNRVISGIDAIGLARKGCCNAGRIQVSMAGVPEGVERFFRFAGGFEEGDESLLFTSAQDTYPVRSRGLLV